MTNRIKIPAILPKLEWEIDKEYKFRIPFSVNGMKELQVLTTRPNSDELIWANSRGHKYSKFPYEIHLKDVIFGVLPRHSKNIIWVDNQKNLDSRLIQAFCFKGTSVNKYNYEKTYNPYSKYSSFQLNELACKRNIQVSLWRLVESYKRSGKWEEMRNTLKYINDVRCRTSLSGIWKYLLTIYTNVISLCQILPCLWLCIYHLKKNQMASYHLIFCSQILCKQKDKP